MGAIEVPGFRKTVTLLVGTTSDVIAVADGQAYYRVPSTMNGHTLVSVAMAAHTVSTSGAPTVQLRRSRAGADVDMLSTKVSIDANETDSSTAATPPVITGANADVLTGDRIFVDVDVAGANTKMLAVEMQFEA